MCGGPQSDKGEYARVGLLPNHAYSIMDVRCIAGERPLRLMRLRNPWGKHAWKGGWCDNDPVWWNRPDLKKELQPRRGEQGIFWIEYHEFLKYVCVASSPGLPLPWYNAESRTFDLLTSHIKRREEGMGMKLMCAHIMATTAQT